MKKHISIFLTAAILLGMLVAFPVFAEETSHEVYQKDSVIKATVLMPSADSFVGIEGKMTYDSTKLEYCSGSFKAPNASDMKFSDDDAGVIPFNSSSLYTYDISSDHIVVSAKFKVLEEMSVVPISAEIEDAYLLAELSDASSEESAEGSSEKNPDPFIPVDTSCRVEITRDTVDETSESGASEQSSSESSASEADTSEAASSETATSESVSSEAAASESGSYESPKYGHIVLDTSGVDTGDAEWKAWTWADGEDGYWAESHAVSSSEIMFDWLEKNVLFAYFAAGTGTPDDKWTGLYKITSDQTVEGSLFTITDVSSEWVQGVWSGECYEYIKPSVSESGASESAASEAAASEATTSETAASEAGASESNPSVPDYVIHLTAKKTKIYVGGTTTINCRVIDLAMTSREKVTIKCSDTKIATVSSTGKVKGLKAGTVTISAAANGVKATVTIKVVKKANTVKFTAKKSVKVKAGKSVKAITVKKAKGKVVYKVTTKNSKKFSVKKGKLVAKKGVKTGKYIVKVKVTAKGTKAYKAKAKTFTVKVTVK